MAELRFTWDERKNAANARKHGVTFEEAQTVFLDAEALLIGDPDHSDDEDRFVLLGLSARLRTLVVCHCYRERAGLIRIISARKADRTEQARYAERRRR
ncbi:BrnT family toxin [Candidatus Binatia bacterium]|nr:BrnT family toxin [Candidatus Binatia bacterium]